MIVAVDIATITHFPGAGANPNAYAFYAFLLAFLSLTFRYKGTRCAAVKWS